MMNDALRRLWPQAFHPAKLVADKVEARSQGGVIAGPFKGLRYIDSSVGSAHFAKVLGTYELEIHSILDRLCAENPAHVVDVGAAEGYYAVGMLHRCRSCFVTAFESSAEGRKLLGEMARLNRCEDRISIRGHCGMEELRAALSEGKNPLIIMDVEGGERELLDPERIGELRHCQILVELHEFVHSGIGALIRSRFDSSHTITECWTQKRSARDVPWISPWLARWTLRLAEEFRPAPMSWFLMTPRFAEAKAD